MRWVGLKLFAALVCVTLLLSLPGAMDFVKYRILMLPLPLYDCIPYVFDHTSEINRVDTGEILECWAEVRITPLAGYAPGGLTPETVYGAYAEGDDLYMLLEQPGGTVLCKSDLHTGEWVKSVPVESRWQFRVSETAITVLCPDVIRRFDRDLEPLEETALAPGLLDECTSPPSLGADGEEIYYLNRAGFPVIYHTGDRTKELPWSDVTYGEQPFEIESFLHFGAAEPYGETFAVFTQVVPIPEENREKGGPEKERVTYFVLFSSRGDVIITLSEFAPEEGGFVYLDQVNGWFNEIVPGWPELAFSQTGGYGRFLFGGIDNTNPIVLLDALNGLLIYNSDAFDTMTEATPLRILEGRTVLCRLQESDGEPPYLAAVTFI